MGGGATLSSIYYSSGRVRLVSTTMVVGGGRTTISSRYYSLGKGYYLLLGSQVNHIDILLFWEGKGEVEGVYFFDSLILIDRF